MDHLLHDLQAGRQPPPMPSLHPLLAGSLVRSSVTSGMAASPLPGQPELVRSAMVENMLRDVMAAAKQPGEPRLDLFRTVGKAAAADPFQAPLNPSTLGSHPQSLEPPTASASPLMRPIVSAPFMKSLSSTLADEPPAKQERTQSNGSARCSLSSTDWRPLSDLSRAPTPATTLPPALSYTSLCSLGSPGLEGRAEGPLDMTPARSLHGDHSSEQLHLPPSFINNSASPTMRAGVPLSGQPMSPSDLDELTPRAAFQSFIEPKALPPAPTPQQKLTIFPGPSPNLPKIADLRSGCADGLMLLSCTAILIDRIANEAAAPPPHKPRLQPRVMDDMDYPRFKRARLR